LIVLTLPARTAMAAAASAGATFAGATLTGAGALLPGAVVARAGALDVWELEAVVVTVAGVAVGALFVLHPIAVRQIKTATVVDRRFGIFIGPRQNP
jgi:hypothetical protein